ncbi:MAG: three-Cys-motif partner protein TcmP [Chloroflexi bacterium]|nr:three-Cys-motif partner protein TcmP [Chloroflexota bacterium]
MINQPYDRIGYWSEIKLDIVREYASAYSRNLSAQKQLGLTHVYIDAFAGAGVHISRTTGEYVLGSPLNALLIQPPFAEYHLIDLDSKKVQSLRDMVRDRPEVTIYEGDCNTKLLNQVFPRVRFEDYRRALCMLDPYGLHLNWEVMQAAGRMRSVEIFLNFPVADMNRNVLWRVPENVDPKQAARMTAFWGDESWRQAAYDTQGNLFGWEEKTDNQAVVDAFRKRLQAVAGFKHVPEPIPMRNLQGATVYYLFFASQKPVAAKIVEYIFRKYRDAGKP